MRHRHLICIVFLAAALICGFGGKALAASSSSSSFGITLGTDGSSIQFGQQHTTSHGNGYGYAERDVPPPPRVAGPHRPPHHPPHHPGPHHPGLHHPPHHPGPHHPGPHHPGPHHPRPHHPPH